MAAEPKRIHANHDTRLEPILREATARPIIIEMDGNTYRIDAERIPSSPYTLESVYGSLPPLRGRKGTEISNEELIDMIESAKEENARDVLNGMNSR